jgi:hypothetical protein
VKGDDGIRSENLVKKGARVIKRDIAVFAFFLFLSFIFWYLNSLGKEMEAGINYLVKFTNLPKERVISENQPSHLNLFLKGPGYSILKLKIAGNNAPVVIDISKVNYRRAVGDRALNYFIVTSGLTKSLNVQMRSGCEITSIKPDTLFFTLEKVIANSTAVPDARNDIKKKK